MSKQSSNQVSLIYITEVLEIVEQCPRRTCDGTLTKVLVRYKPNTPLKEEKECSTCGKVFRDRPFKKGRGYNKSRHQEKK